MVSTRSHYSTTSSPSQLSPSTRSSDSPSTLNRASNSPASPPSRPKPWAHTPDRLTLAWLLISLPLVLWDTLYVFLRPHSMPGGFLHSPLWVPYALYGTVDHVYGLRAWEAHNGFTAAQSALNAVETVAYATYLWWVWGFGRDAEGKVGKRGSREAEEGRHGGGPVLAGRRIVEGRWAGRAVLLGFTASVMTVSKTALYWLNEYYSGFENIGHNDALSLVFLWIIPNLTLQLHQNLRQHLQDGLLGFGLLQSDHDYDCAGELSAEADIELLHPEDPEAVCKKLDDGTLSRMFDSHENRTRYPISTTVVLGVLARQVGAKIEDRHLELLRTIYKSAGNYEEGKRQMRKALEAYKNDGTPYFIGSLGLYATADFNDAQERGEIPHLCMNCDKPETEKELKRCAKCKTNLYCSRECQKVDWKTHKRFCRLRPSPPQPRMPNPSGMRSLNADIWNAMRAYH